MNEEFGMDGYNVSKDRNEEITRPDPLFDILDKAHTVDPLGSYMASDEITANVSSDCIADTGRLEDISDSIETVPHKGGRFQRLYDLGGRVKQKAGKIFTDENVPKGILAYGGILTAAGLFVKALEYQTGYYDPFIDELSSTWIKAGIPITAMGICLASGE